MRSMLALVVVAQLSWQHSAMGLAMVPRRFAVGALAGMGVQQLLPAVPALAKPPGVNKPELLPKEQTNVIQMKDQKYLTSGQIKRMDEKHARRSSNPRLRSLACLTGRASACRLAKLEKDTGFKLRVLVQQYPETPGLAIKDYWNLNDNVRMPARANPPHTPPLMHRVACGLTQLCCAGRQSIVLVADKGAKGTANLLNFNVAEGVKLALPNSFWTRLQNTFGNTFFVRDNGEDTAIVRAIDTIDFCLRDGFCVDVPDNFKKGEAAEAFGSGGGGSIFN